jgi:hypothetical protein
VSDDHKPDVSPSENEVPDDKGSETIEEYGSRTDDDESATSSPESRRSLASRPGGETRVPNFLPPDTKVTDTDDDR